MSNNNVHDIDTLKNQSNNNAAIDKSIPINNQQQEPFRQAPSPSIKMNGFQTTTQRPQQQPQQQQPQQPIINSISKPISLSLTSSTNTTNPTSFELMSYLKPSKLERTTSTGGVLSDHESSMNEPEQTLSEKLEALQERSGEVF